MEEVGGLSISSIGLRQPDSLQDGGYQRHALDRPGVGPSNAHTTTTTTTTTMMLPPSPSSPPPPPPPPPFRPVPRSTLAPGTGRNTSTPSAST